MTPRLSVIGAALRKLLTPVGLYGDVYWNNVVLASKFDITADPMWSRVSLAMHMDGADNGVVFTDEKGKTVTPTGNVCTKTAIKKFGTASAYFDGTGDYLSVASNTGFGFGVGDFTLEAWVYTTNNGTVFDFRSGATEIGACGISGGCIAWWNGSQYVTGSTSVVTGTWVHLAWVRYRKKLLMFVNGVLDAVCDSTLDLGAVRPLRIGADYAGANTFTGYIDDVRITKAARYAGMFSTNPYPFMEPNNKPVFLEETGKTFSVSGNTSASAVAKYGSGSVSFDGNGDYLTIPSSEDFNFGSNDFTIEMYVCKLGDTSVVTGTGIILDMRASEPGNYVELHINNSTVANPDMLELYVNGSTRIRSTSTFGEVYKHVALVRSSGVIKLYVDGVKEGSDYVDASAYGVTGVTIGGRFSPVSGDYRSHNGRIDELRITKGIARYVSNFTPSDRGLSNYTKDKVDPYLSYVVLGLHMEGVDNGTSFTEFRGKTVTPSGNTCTKTGTKKFGTSSAYFDGTGDYLSVASDTDLQLGTSDFTIEFWMMPTAVLKQYSGSYFASVCAKDAPTGRSFWIRLTGGASSTPSGIQFAVTADGSSFVAAQGSATFPLNVWKHIAIVRKNNLLYAFVDGVLLNTPVSFTASVNNTTTPLRFGMDGYSSGEFTGYIDDVRITKGVGRYTSNFQPEQYAFPEKQYNVEPVVGDMYWGNTVLGMHMDGADNGTTFTDAKGKTVTPVGNACTKTAIKMFGTASAFFDGTGDYLNVQNSTDFSFSTSDDFTIEAWIYPLSLSTPQYQVIFGGAYGELAFNLVNTSIELGKWYVTRIHGTNGGVIVQGVWQHVAVTRSGGLVRIFVNGVAIGVAVANNEAFSYAANPRVGASSYATNYAYFNGYIDDLRITKGAARYTTDFTPPGRFPEVLAEVVATQSNLVAYLDAKNYTSGQTWANSKTAPADGSGQTLYDFTLGTNTSVETSDPTYVSAGDASYFSFDGGDYFTKLNALTTYMQTMHYAAKSWTIELWALWDGTLGSNVNPMFDSGTSDQGGSDMSRGVIFMDLSNFTQTGGRMTLRVKRDSFGASALNVQTDAAIATNAVQMLALSYTADGSSFFYRNGAYEKVAGADTFTATLASPGASPATNAPKLGARGDGAFRVPNGTRLYLARFYNTALSKADLDSLWSATKSRFGL